MATTSVTQGAERTYTTPFHQWMGRTLRTPPEAVDRPVLRQRLPIAQGVPLHPFTASYLFCTRPVTAFHDQLLLDRI